MNQPSALQTRATLPRSSTPSLRRGHRPGFSLIELLVVMFIIVMVMSIIVPALAKARKLTKQTATSTVMQNLLQAANSFQLSERRLPGRYSVRDMGSDDNGNDRGMSMVENMLLDLSGGIVQIGGAKPTDGGLLVHPFGGASSSRATQEGCWVQPGLIGQPTRSGKGYFIPDRKYFAEQIDDAQVGASGKPDADGQTYPDMVDAFGQPLIAWIEDESVVGTVKFDGNGGGPNNFARVTSTGSASPARHYWNANACFIKSPKLGKLANSNKDMSLLSPDFTGADSALTLMGLLGGLSSPTDIGTPAAAKDAKQILPTSSRGKIVIQSAGVDGVFLNGNDAQGRGQFTGSVMHYGYNFVEPTSTSAKLRVDGAGKPATVDVAASFDDVIVAGGS